RRLDEALPAAHPGNAVGAGRPPGRKVAEASMAEAVLRVFRGGPEGGAPVDYTVPVAPGMVVLDALRAIQAGQAPHLPVRSRCKAGKCGSCSAGVNGRPRRTCKTRMDSLPND